MKVYIKNYSLQNIKTKLLLLYILNVTDIVFTRMLLSTGFYMEANTLMVKAVQNLAASIAFKIVLPAALLTYLYFRIRKATDQQLKKSNFLINGAIVIYALINISHLVWFAILPIFILIF